MALINGTDNKDYLLGSPEADLINGLAGDDQLDGNAGDDTLNGGTGDDTMRGGSGSDLYLVDDAGDLAIEIADNGIDTVSAGVDFTLGANVENLIARVKPSRVIENPVAIARVGVGNQLNNRMEVLSALSTSTLFSVKFSGLEGNDTLVGASGNDTLDGGIGDDFIQGKAGKDTLTGGNGSDRFIYDRSTLTGGTPISNPDTILDFNQADDQVGLSATLGIDSIRFQSGLSSQLFGDRNVLVLHDPFPNAAAAAKAIADNNAVTANAGVFVYFNSTIGISRLVHSQDLSDAGDITVLANLANQTFNGQLSFTSQNFGLA